MSNIGIVSASYVDHIGMTVPDLDQAIAFFEKALGAQLLWREGPFHETPTGVAIRDVTLVMMRLGPNINVELMSFEADEQRKQMPSNIDYGAAHIAFFVHNLEAAAESLAKNGAKLLRGPIEASGESKRGERIWYLKTPWGAYLEILWRPDHLPYERNTKDPLFKSEDGWTGKN